ncbi:MAG: hypothetical protein ABSC48_06745 [Terracidiphilus sp.]
MNPRLVVLLLCASLFPAVQAAAKTILPDSCGDPDIKFDVRTEKDQPPPAPPEAGKAQIIFTESGLHGIARYGVDGAWVGATDDDSYFAVSVDPGEHHLCMSYEIPWTLGSKMKEDSARMLTFTAEAGKVYYFSAHVITRANGTGPVGKNYEFRFLPIDEEKGKYRVKAWKLAIPTPKK